MYAALVQHNCILTVLLLDSRISAVCERAAAAVAQPSYIVLISAEVLRRSLCFEAAVMVVDDLRGDMQVFVRVPKLGW